MSYVAKSEDDDVAKVFVDSLVKDVEDIYKRFLGKPKKMIFTAVEEEIFNNSTSCHICGEELGLIIIIIIIIIRAFVRRTMSASELNLRRRQSLGGEDG